MSLNQEFIDKIFKLRDQLQELFDELEKQGFDKKLANQQEKLWDDNKKTFNDYEAFYKLNRPENYGKESDDVAADWEALLGDYTSRPTTKSIKDL